MLTPAELTPAELTPAELTPAELTACPNAMILQRCKWQRYYPMGKEAELELEPESGPEPEPEPEPVRFIYRTVSGLIVWILQRCQ